MTVRAALIQSTNSFQVGQTPPPQAVLRVANDAASALVVTGVELYVQDLLGNPLRGWSGNLPMVPIGVGQTTSIPAASGSVQGSLDIGPFAITAPLAGTGNQYQAVPPQTQPSNSQGALPQQTSFMLRARVYTNDGAVTEATPAQFFVSYANPPPPGIQGGYAMFSDQDNSPLLAAVF